jgi:hypothetical protein
MIHPFVTGLRDAEQEQEILERSPGTVAGLPAVSAGSRALAGEASSGLGYGDRRQRPCPTDDLRGALAVRDGASCRLAALRAQSPVTAGSPPGGSGPPRLLLPGLPQRHCPRRREQLQEVRGSSTRWPCHRRHLQDAHRPRQDEA